MVKVAPLLTAARSLLREGYSKREAARVLGVSKSGLGAALKRKRKGKRGRGRPRVLTPTEVRRALRMLAQKNEKNEDSSAVTIHRHLGLQCSVTSLRRSLRRNGYRYAARISKGTLTAEDARVRLAWARRVLRNSPARFFASVKLWHDAKFFPMPLRHTPMRTPKVWRKPGQQLRSWAVRPNSRFKAPGAKILAGFGPASRRSPSSAVLYVHKYDRLTAHVAAQVFRSKIAPALRRKYGSRGKLLLQQDGDRCFWAASTRAALRSLRLEPVTGLPPRSPDLWPMENVWANVCTRLQKHAQRTSLWRNGASVNKRNLRNWAGLVRRTIRKTKPSFLRRLVAGMPARLKAVVKAKGWAIGK